MGMIEEMQKEASRNAETGFDIPELREAIEAKVESQIANRKRDLENAVKNALARIKTYQRRIREAFSDVSTARTELERLTGNEPVDIVMQEIEEVLTEGCWINPVINDGYLYLNTKNHVVMTCKNSKANVDTTIDFGQLAVEIDLNSFCMSVIPYKNNLRYKKPGQDGSGFFHPYICDDGEICWGNGSDQVDEWISELKIGSVLKLLYSLLMNYHEDTTPWCAIHFFREAKKYGRCSEDLKHPDKKKTTKKKEEPPLFDNVRWDPPVVEVVRPPSAPVYNPPIYTVQNNTNDDDTPF
jgi:hypothetical protein